MRWCNRALLLILGAFCLLALAEMLARSGIPLSFQGKVRSRSILYEKYAGIDDVHLADIGGKVRHLDAGLARELLVGDELAKKPWERTLQTPRGEVRLTLSRDFWGALVVMPWLLAAGWILARFPRRRTESR